MNTTGLSALERHHALVSIETLELRAASIPAIVGLKLLAYADRRPGILRDIQDVDVMLQQAEGCVPESRIAAEALERLRGDELEYPEVGAYLLARIIHEASAATSQLPAPAGFPSLRGLNDLPEVVSGALGREPLHLQAFATFRSNPHE